MRRNLFKKFISKKALFFSMLFVPVVISIVSARSIANSDSAVPDSKPAGLNYTEKYTSADILEDETGAVSQQNLPMEDNTVKLHQPDAFFKTASFTQTASDISPVGTVLDLEVELSGTDVQLVDLSEYGLEVLAFKWDQGYFKYGLSDQKSVPELKKVEISDDMGIEMTGYVSELISCKDKKYLFVEPYEGIASLSIDLINPSSGGFRTSGVAANHNSGPKYSSLNIIPREQWSQDANINDPRLRGDGGRLTWNPCYYDITKVVVHHTATPNNEDPIYWMKAIYSYHANSFGWGDIGYNYIIDQYGNIYEGKLGGEEAKGYHAGCRIEEPYCYRNDGNPNSIGISVIGTYTDSAPSSAAQDAVKRLIAEKAAFYNFTPGWHSTVFGHRDFMKTACPGNAFYAVLPSLTASAAAYKNSHFSDIKSVVSKVNKGIDYGAYRADLLHLLFSSNVSSSTLAGLMPFYNNQPVDWSGVQSYEIRGKKAILSVNYHDRGCRTQSTKSRLRTLYKTYWLRGDVDACSLNFSYGVN